MAFGSGALVGTSRVRLELDKSRFDRDWRRAEHDMRRGSSSLSRHAGSLVGGIGRAVGTGVKLVAGLSTAFAGAAIYKGGRRLVAIDQAQAKLRGLGHDAESVREIMDNALQSVLGTAFGLDEAATIAAAAVAAGIKPGQELEKYLKLTADAATIAGTGLAEMGSIINGVTANQRVFGEDLNQLADRGIPIIQWLGDEYGVSAVKLRDMVSKGQVDARKFRKVIEDNIGGAALEAGDTAQGSIANTGAALSRLGAGILGPFFGGIPEMFQSITDGLDRMTARVAPFAQEIADRLLPFIDRVFEERTFSGKARVVLTGVADVARDFWAAIFEPRNVERRVEVRPGRMMKVTTQDPSLARQFGDAFVEAVRSVDWHAVGEEIRRGMLGIAADIDEWWTENVQNPTREKVKDTFTFDDASDFNFKWPWEKGAFDPLPSLLKKIDGVGDAVWDSVNAPFEGLPSLDIRIEDLFGAVETESAHAATSSSSGWATSMERVEKASQRALADVRAELADTRGSTVQSISRVEDLRGQIGRLTGKEVDVTANVRFSWPDGTVSDAHDRRTGDGLGVGITNYVKRNARPQVPMSANRTINPHLWDELGYGQMLGLSLSSGYRAGAITSSGNKSFHSYFPSKAIDMASGSSAGYADPAMRALFNFAAGRPGLNEVILDPYLWTPGGITNIAGTALGRDHRDHVHVGGHGDGLGVAGRFMGDGLGLPAIRKVPVKYAQAPGGMLPHRRKGESWAKYFARLRDPFENRYQRGITRADFLIDLANRVADRKQRLRDRDGVFTAAEAQARKRDISHLLKMMRRKRSFILDTAKWASLYKYRGRAAELRRDASGIWQDILDMRIDRDEVEPDTGGQGAAFSAALTGFLGSFASNIFTSTGGGGLAFGSAALGGPGVSARVSGGTSAPGGRSVTVVQNFHQPPEDNHPLMRSAEFAAAAAFGD